MVQIAFVPFALPELPSVGFAFTSRRGGASAPPFDAANLSYDVGDNAESVTRNREALRARLQLEALADCRQVHQDAVFFDARPDSGREADGMTTTQAGLGLMVKTADCQPVLLAHESGRFIAGLHVGWRGNRINFPGSGVRAFCEHYALRPEELFAVRGPSLGPEEAQFVHFMDEFGPEFSPWYDPATATVNLWQLTRDQLLRAGLRPERIHGVDLCTKTRSREFYSYRRDKTTGRQAGIVWIRP